MISARLAQFYTIVNDSRNLALPVLMCLYTHTFSSSLVLSAFSLSLIHTFSRSVLCFPIQHSDCACVTPVPLW